MRICKYRCLWERGERRLTHLCRDLYFRLLRLCRLTTVAMPMAATIRGHEEPGVFCIRNTSSYAIDVLTGALCIKPGPLLRVILCIDKLSRKQKKGSLQERSGMSCSLNTRGREEKVVEKEAYEGRRRMKPQKDIQPFFSSSSQSQHRPKRFHPLSSPIQLFYTLLGLWSH